MDTFKLEANGLALIVDNTINDEAAGVTEFTIGTRISLTIATQKTRNLADIFNNFTSPETGSFDHSRTRISLVRLDGEFLSRSEARRIASGLEKFRHVDLDFAKVDFVDQGFADELFRVWARMHPNTRIVPLNANRVITMMLGRADTTTRVPSPADGAH